MLSVKARMQHVAGLALHSLPTSVLSRANSVQQRLETEIERRSSLGIKRFLPLTMVDEQSLRSLRLQVIDLVGRGVGGAIVECGAWRGGAGFVMASALAEVGDERRVWLFDSFEGLPAPEPIDGPGANQWASTPDGPTYNDNCTASLDDVQIAISHFGFSGTVVPIKGWFEDSLPSHRDAVGPIAILRIDADWYASVKVCLESMFERVVPGGIIIFDDYDLWDGCTLAVHEFLAARQLPLGIRRDKGRPYVQLPAG